MIARMPVHVRTAGDGGVVVTAVPFTDLSFGGSSYEAAVDELMPALRERIADLDPIDRLLHASEPATALLRVEVSIASGSSDDPVEIAVGVVTVERTVRARPVLLAYPVAVAGLELLQRDRDVDRLRQRVAKQVGGRMKSWSATALVAADEPEDTTVRTLEVEVPHGPSALHAVDDPDDTGILEELGVDLTRTHSARIDRREELVRRTLETLAAVGRSSVLLVGPPDVGKTALVHEFARRIATGEAPPALAGRTVWRISANELIAGAQYTGMWQDRARKLVDQARRTRAIVVMGDPVGIVDAGRWSKSDNNVSRLLRPYVESGEVTIVCEATAEQLAAAHRREPSFVDAFHRIDVVEPTREETLAIAADAALRLGADVGIEVRDDAVAAAVELTKRFEPYRSFPGKTVRLLEDAVRERSEGTTVVDRRAITETFSRRTGMPLGLLSDDVVLRVDDIRAHFESRVLGQPDATATMTDAVTVLKAGLNDPHKPLGSFFFVGPTGVGKTELAKALAEFLFGSTERVVRLDMGEFASGDAMAKLLGSAWDADTEGQLTRRVREQPFCVVLLDEIEKAHWSVFDALLAALGEGRLADASGRTADFRNAIVIMTSNLGARRARSSGLGFGSGEGGAEGAHYVAEAEKFFRPEFFNRIDRIVVFHELSAETVRRIARRELERLLEREGIARRELRIEIDDAVVDAIAAGGFHPRYGARPLQRQIERSVIGPLARLLVERSPSGSDFVRVRRVDGEISVSVTRPTAAETRAPRRERRPERADPGFERAAREAVELCERIAADEAAVSADELRGAISELVGATHRPDFWADAERARTTLRRIYRLEALVHRFDALAERADGLAQMARRVRETQNRARLGEIGQAIAEIGDTLVVLRLELAAASAGAEGEGAFVRVTPIGRDAAGWAEQLAAMYEAWAERTARDVEGGTDDGLAFAILGPATLDLLAGEGGLHRHVRPDRSEALARVTVTPLDAAVATPDGDAGAVVRIYEEGRRRGVRDPRTGARESHVNNVLDAGRIDSFLIAWLRATARSTT